MACSTARPETKHLHWEGNSSQDGHVLGGGRGRTDAAAGVLAAEGHVPQSGPAVKTATERVAVGVQTAGTRR
jgi:hypothetical protein